MKPYKMAVIIGRFQPFHNGHKKLIEHAYTLADSVLVLIGSHNLAPSIQNPLYAVTRAESVRLLFPAAIIRYLDDEFCDKEWLQNLHAAIRQEYPHEDFRERVCLVGSVKDDKQTNAIGAALGLRSEFVGIDDITVNGTNIREHLFDFGFDDIDTLQIPELTWRLLVMCWPAHLKAEWEYVREYKHQHEGKGYPPIYCTADVILHLELTDEVIVIVRKNQPGEGLLALPGGFVEQQESFQQCAERELMEEIGIEMIPDLHGFCIADNPKRDPRARIISHVFFATNLRNIRLQAGDDASDYKIVSRNFVKENMHRFFLDHGLILQRFFRSKDERISIRLL